MGNKLTKIAKPNTIINGYPLVSCGKIYKNTKNFSEVKLSRHKKKKKKKKKTSIYVVYSFFLI